MLRMIEKLQRRARELDQQVKRSLAYEGYDFAAADDRALLEEALRMISHAFVLTSLAESVIMETDRVRLNT